MFVASALHHNINGGAILIDRASHILLFPVNGDTDFIEVPGLTQATLTLLQFPRIGQPKLLVPLANGFIGDRDASFGEEFFDFPKAQAKTMA